MLSTAVSVLASAALLVAQGVSAQTFNGPTSSGGLTINAPSTNPTTCDPLTLSFSYTGNTSWSLSITTTNAFVNQAPLGYKPYVFKAIVDGALAGSLISTSVNWTVNVPEGYYVLQAEARPYDTFPTNATTFTPAEANSERFQVVNGSSTACIYGQPAPTSSGVNVGAIVGGVIGGLALLALLAIAACCLIKRRKSSKRARMSGAIAIDDQKKFNAEKSSTSRGYAADPFTKGSANQRDAISTAYDEDSTRAGSVHTNEPAHITDQHQNLADPFADQHQNGDYLPSARSSGLDPDNQAFGDLHAANGGGNSPSVGSKSTRKPAPEYDGVEDESPRSTPYGSQPHLIIPDKPAAI